MKCLVFKSIFAEVIALIFILNSSVSNAQNSFSIDEKVVLSGDYYPYIKLIDNDSLELPIEVEIELFVKAIRDLQIKSNYFYAELADAAHIKYDTVYVTQALDTVAIGPRFVRLLYPESDQTFIDDWYYDGKFGDYVQITRSIIEVVLPHKWNLRDYPFDKQYLEFRYRANEDTSFVRLKESINFPASMNSNFPYLLDGFSVESISSRNDFYKSPTLIETESGKRNEINEELVFEILVDRSGAFLYFKLFFGAILSFIVSYLVFFIDRQFFETRITLSLGGIFGAVGNKYFVESSMPEIQVLTKADFINNLIILLIIGNIFLVIAQQSKLINLRILEKNQNSAIFMLILFVLTNFCVVMF